MQNQPINQRKQIHNYSYNLNDCIGKGYSSKVFKGRNDNSNTVVAIKVIDMKNIKMGSIHYTLLQNEIKGLQKLKNKHVLELYDVY